MSVTTAGTKTKALSVCALALAMACRTGSTSGGSQPEEGSPRLTLSCAPLVVTAGQGPVDCVASLQGASDPVTWSLSGPGQLSAPEGSAVGYLPPASLVVDATAQISAAAGALQATAQVQVLAHPTEPSGITVAGKVVDEYAGPLEGEKVLVAGLPPVTTDATGGFQIDGVQAPYDLVVVRDSSHTAFVYQGLTRADPTLFVEARDSGQPGSAGPSARVDGEVNGGDALAEVFGDYQAVLFSSPQTGHGLGSRSPSVALALPLASYSLPVAWHGPSSTTGSLLAIQWRRDPASGAPTGYWLAVQHDLTLLSLSQDSGDPPAPPAPLELQPAAAITTRCAITLPPTYALQGNLVGITFPASGAAFRLFFDDLSTAGLATGEPYSVQYLLPAIAGARVQVCALGRDTRPRYADTQSIACIDATGASETSIGVPESAEPFAPANQGNDVTSSTAFHWRPLPRGVHVLELTPRQEGLPRYVVFTGASSAVIPDLTAESLGLPAGSQYDWAVRGLAPLVDLDALAAPRPVAPSWDFPIPTMAESSWAQSTPYTFTTR